MPGGLTLLASLAADIPTPPAGKVTIFFNTAAGQPYYKDSAGLLFSLVGVGGQGPTGQIIIGEDGLDGDSGFPGIPGVNGSNGTTGAQGPMGPVFIGLDGIDGDDSHIPGQPGAAGASGATDVLLVRVALTELQIESWNTVPIQLVAAQGANRIIIPIMFSIQLTLTTAYTSTPTIQLVWGTDNINLLSGVVPSNLNAGAPSTRINSAMGASILSNNYTTIDPRNQALNLVGSANPGTPGTGVATAIVNLLYAIATE